MRIRLVILLCIALLFAISCSGSEPQTEVFAASSLTEVFETLDQEARFNFAGSDELAAQIREGAAPDVYASASERYGEELFTEDLVAEPVAFATNRLVIIVPREGSVSIDSWEDLLADGVKVVMAAEGVPAGDYAREAIETLDAEAILANVVSEEQDVKGVVGKVALGEADAGFTYATDVNAAADDIAVIELPEGVSPTITYVIAAVLAGDEGTARAFIDLVLSDEGRNRLRDAGFGLP